MSLNENIRNAKLTIGATVTEVSARADGGTYSVRLFQNNSTAGQIITLCFDGEAVAGEGIVLYPYGSWGESIDNVFIPANVRVTAIADAAGGILSIHERVRTDLISD